jgi:hypothetical protein
MKLKKTATETFNLLREAYGENSASRARASEGRKRLSEGTEGVQDELPGYLEMMKTGENVEKVSEDSCENRSS